MTPLLGTKTSSAPVGDAPAGDNKAAQATAFQVFMRPETQDAALAGREAQASANSEVSRKTKNKKLKTDFEVLHEIPITSHESRPFFPPETGFYRVKPGLCRLIATFYRIITGQKPAIPHNSSEFVGIRRIATSAPSRCPRTVRIGNTAGWVFTSHESRNMVFPCSSGDSKESNSKPGQRAFHETRDTKHESRPLCLCRCFPARCGAASGVYGAAWAAVVPRAGNTACWVFTSHETRNMVFPCSSGDSKESNPKPDQQVFTKHETRNTNHGLYAFLPTISHDFPAFPAILRPPLPPESVSARRPPQLPPPSGLLPQRQKKNEPC